MRTDNQLFIAFAALLFVVSTSVYAQEVKWDASQAEGARVVIDNTGLPAAALYDNGLSVQTDANPAWSHERTLVNRVARKFSVATVNTALSATNSGGVGASPCPAGWRIPNQRELMLIWVLTESLRKVATANGISWMVFNNGTYWSSTLLAHDGTSVWSSNFASSSTQGSGFMTHYANSTKLNVRCVQSH